MAAATSALQASELVFYSDSWTTPEAALEVLGASTFTITGVGGGTATITNAATPVHPTDLANKAYVDNAASGLYWKSPVTVTTTAAIVLGSAADASQLATVTIDGVTFTTASVGTRILVNNQTPSSPGNVNNGIYVLTLCTIATFFYWTRSLDMAVSSDASGAAIYTESGTVNGGKAFVETLEPAVVGTNVLEFTVFASIVPVTPGGSSGQIQYNNSGTFGGAALSYAGGNFDVTSGNFTVDLGSLATTVGTISSGSSVSATTTVTAGTGMTSTTGDIVASSGNMSASGTVTGGTGVVATTGNITASGAASQILADGTTDATSTSTGAIVTAGGVGVAKQLWVGTNVTMPGTGAVLALTNAGSSVAVSGTTDATSTSTGSIVTAGGVGVAKQLWVGTNATLAGTNSILALTGTGSTVVVSGTTDSSSATTGSVTLAGGLGVAKQVFIGTNATLSGTSSALALTGASSTVAVSGTTDATSTSTGSIVTAGGVGVAKQLWVGTNVTMPGTGAVLALTDSGSSVAVSGTTNATTSTTGSITTAGGVGVAQDIYVGGNAYATSFKAFSDVTLKTNIKPLTGTLDIVKQIEEVQYNWLDETMGTELQTGVMAQQLEKIGLGHMVDSDHGHKTVAYMALIPYLIGAIKELSHEVDELRTERRNLD